ncbi:MAG: aspartate racemase [Verrucomicrobiota bacterium]|jgi:aspartate racemase
MKTLGIIGGIGPESTIEYYRRIHALYRQRAGDDSAPSIIINSIDMKKLVRWVEADELDEMARYLTGEVETLARGGADFGLLSANTPHLVFDAVAQQASIPLISIVEATCDAAVARGLKRLGLLGTRFTMQSSFYRVALSGHQIELVIPNEEEQACVHDKYMNELVKGIILPETHERLTAIIKTLKERSQIDGVILGGTELSLILREQAVSGVQVLDTTQIHVEAAVARMISSTS